MAYDRLRARLADGEGGRVVALPDGSVDVFYRLVDGRGQTVRSREVLAERIARGGVSSFRMDEFDRQPGGQSVNTARQAAALGDDVTLFGHLDDPIFDALEFQTHSMGDPAVVQAFAFDDGDLMLSEESRSLREWTVESLRDVPDAIPTVLDASVVCVTNWVSVHGIEDALREFAALDVGDQAFVFDAGDVTGADRAALESLIDALSTLADATRLVLTANAPEILRFADVLAVPDGPLRERLATFRSTAGVDAAVVHGLESATVAHPDGTDRVATVPVDSAVRHTGAGDRFNGGLTHALAAGWTWDVALAAGNACASYFVANGDTPDATDLADYLDRASTG